MNWQILGHPRTEAICRNDSFHSGMAVSLTCQSCGLACPQHLILPLPLSPHDALKHHFAYLKDFTKIRVLERKFSWNCFKDNSIFFHLPPTSSHLHPLHVENCDSNSQLIVDEDDNGKLRLERVKNSKIPLWISLFIDLYVLTPRTLMSTRVDILRFN